MDPSFLTKGQMVVAEALRAGASLRIFVIWEKIAITRETKERALGERDHGDNIRAIRIRRCGSEYRIAGKEQRSKRVTILLTWPAHRTETRIWDKVAT